MVPTDSQKTKKFFPFSLGKKRKKDHSTQSDVAIHVSAEQTSKTPKLELHDLSYAGQHLILVLQHHVDAKKIKVFANQTSWKTLVMLNQDVDLLEKRTKKIFGIKDFPKEELDEIARRVTFFLIKHQKEMVVK